ncbi:MAG: apolipoprotein N-acyltransferase [Coxiellaceae bacterium]|jgi:apolipoprotein N-acyltransferase|nr:apolipoprotein N-acyltransferase [Coxiellaceae bacterium]
MMKRSLKLTEKFYRDPYLGITAFISGIILPFAFAPFGCYLLAEFSLILLLFIWSLSSTKMAFWYGGLFGISFFGYGIHWLYISIHHYGGISSLFAGLVVALLVIFLAFYYATFGYLLNSFFPGISLIKFLLVFPISFALLEWIRGWFFSGFPWLFLGYSHIDSPLRGWATIFGIYGVSLVIAETAGASFCILLFRNRKKLVISLVLLIVLLWNLGWIFSRINWTQPIGEPIQVSLIQGNFSQKQKWQKDELINILNTYAFLTAKNFSSKIIVWPETAIPAYPEDIQSYLKSLSLMAKRNGIAILSGIPLKEKNHSYNGIITLGVDENIKYYKRHLVPFGEYLPFRFILSRFHRFFIIPMSDFINGSNDQPNFVVHNIVFAPFICYEIAYPYLVLNYIPKAGMLLTVCDDSWFGQSIASFQHLEIARMRSLEVGRYQLFAANTGITAIINHKGEIVEKAPEFKQSVLNANVQNFVGKTPWVVFGKYLWFLLSLLGLWWSWIKRKSSI